MAIVLSCMMVSVTAGAADSQMPKWGKKTVKSIFTLKTFGADGALMSSATGFFISEDGEGVSSFQPFRGASNAVIIDAAGKEWPVECILGADDTYDVARFRVAAKKTVALPIDSTTQQATLWLQPYLEQRRLQSMTVDRVEYFREGKQYLTLSPAAKGDNAGTPLIDGEGRAVALLQQAAETDTLSYAVSAVFAAQLQMTGLSINSPALRATAVKKALPPTADQALLTLYVASAQMDSAQYALLVEDFILQYPNEPEGYMTRARALMAQARYDEAEQQLQQAENVVKDRENELVFTRLNCQRLRAEMQIAQQQWADAISLLKELNQGSNRSAELFLMTSGCYAQLRDTTNQLAQLDSAVAMYQPPYLREAAPYLLARAEARIAAHKWRQGVTDLNEYEKLMASQLNSNFYYMRYQAEVEGRLYQQALDDIERIISMQPSEDLYVAEKAWLQLRLGLMEEAAETARLCISMAPQNSDGHLFLGIALCQTGQRKQGLESLQKALELGNNQASTLIEKYKQ